jgi:uncharacterized membrane protein SpoIIM required for sporulation
VDLNQFIAENRPQWRKFEKMLEAAESAGLSGLSHSELKDFGFLYRKVSSDLVHVRSVTSNAELTEYLNNLVSRGYAKVYSGRSLRLGAIFEFFMRGFPRELRARFAYLLLSAAVFLGGIAFGFLAVTFDQKSRYYLMSPEHVHTSPAEHARKALEAEEHGGRLTSAGHASFLSTFLFTNNIRVGLLAFASGITLGIGTVLVLAFNGAMLGSVAAAYHESGVTLFFYSWVLPHGVMELTCIVIAGAAGLLLGRAVLWPGEYSTTDSLRIRGRSALILVLGTIPVFIFAGLIEGSLSQINPPTIPYWFKLAVAAATGAFLILYLGFAGRAPSPKADAAPSPADTG